MKNFNIEIQKIKPVIEATIDRIETLVKMTDSIKKVGLDINGVTTYREFIGIIYFMKLNDGILKDIDYKDIIYLLDNKIVGESHCDYVVECIIHQNKFGGLN